MFDMSTVDVIIGLVSLYMLMSLLCSTTNELIEGFWKNRAKYLEKGIREFIGDNIKASATEVGTNEFVEYIYNHGLINSLYHEKYNEGKKGKLPSYIPPRNFSLAFNAAVKEFTMRGKTLPPNVVTALSAFSSAAGIPTGFDQCEAQISDWYKSATERIAGAYKRRSQWVILLIGLVATIFMNVDTFKVAQKLSSDSTARRCIVAEAEIAAKNQGSTQPGATTAAFQSGITNIKEMGFPIGWDFTHGDSDATAIAAHVPGWIITVLAISLGAPFWFDVLNKFIVLRATFKSDETTPASAAKPASPQLPPDDFSPTPWRGIVPEAVNSPFPPDPTLP